MRSNEIEVANAQPEDITALVALESLLFQEDAGRHDPFSDTTWPEREGRQDLEQLIESPDALVLAAKSSGEVVGLLVLGTGTRVCRGPRRSLRSQPTGSGLLRASRVRAAKHFSLHRRGSQWCRGIEQVAGRHSATRAAHPIAQPTERAPGVPHSYGGSRGNRSARDPSSRRSRPSAIRRLVHRRGVHGLLERRSRCRVGWRTLRSDAGPCRHSAIREAADRRKIYGKDRRIHGRRQHRHRRARPARVGLATHARREGPGLCDRGNGCPAHGCRRTPQRRSDMRHRRGQRHLATRRPQGRILRTAAHCLVGRGSDSPPRPAAWRRWPSTPGTRWWTRRLASVRSGHVECPDRSSSLGTQALDGGFGARGRRVRVDDPTVRRCD